MNLKGHEGLGDELEHYIFHLNIAKLFEATIVLTDGGLKYGSLALQHVGVAEYPIMSSLLGIDISLNMTDINLQYKPKIFNLEFKDALDMKMKLLAGIIQLECNTVIQSSIDSCPGGWCPLTYPSHYNFIEQVSPWLKKNTAKLKCSKMHLGMSYTDF